MTQKTSEEEAKEKETLEKLIEELEAKGVHPTKLAIFHVGSDQILSELAEDDDFESVSEHIQKYGFINIDDPKRIIRLQQVQGGGITLSFMIGDFDLIEGGEINIAPSLWYRVASQNVPSAISILTLYKEYLERKTMNKAEAAGLVLPQSTIRSPFKK